MCVQRGVLFELVFLLVITFQIAPEYATMTADTIPNTNHRYFDVVHEPCTTLTPITGYSREPLVSLEKATEGLKQLVPEIQTYVHVAKTRASKSIKDLPIDQSAAIALYTMEWSPYDQSLYYILNKTLRTEDRRKLKPWFPYLKLILTGFSRLPKSKLTVYRGMRSEIEGGYEKYDIGKEIIWWGFSSCSKIQAVAEKEQFMGETGRRTLFVIECTNGREIGKHSYFQKEREVLLPPATSVQVVDRKIGEDGVLTIYLREVISQFKYLEDPESPIRTADNADTESVISDDTGSDRQESERPYNQQLSVDLSRFKPRSEVYLLGRRFNSHDMEMIVQHSIVGKQCRALFLRESGITAEGAIVIAKALSNANYLERLFISHNNVGDVGAIEIAKALRQNVTLKQLCLGYDAVTDIGIEELVATLEVNRTLTHLWLPSNKITDRGLRLLAEVLTNSNRTLQVLSLEWNRFSSDTSVDILVGMINLNKSLTTLNLNNCRLSRSAIRQLKNAAKHKKNFNLTIH